MLAAPPPPSADDQVLFLRCVQRLLEEGSFVATYKYALLHSLADLAVRLGDDSGAPLVLSTSQVAEAMIDLYWRQAVPFPAPACDPAMLRQNIGSPAKIVTLIADARSALGPSMARARHDSLGWRRLVQQVERVVSDMPLWKLQTVGDGTLDFLYENVGRGQSITLRQGVPYCLRTFHGLVTDLVRAAWLRYVRRHNAALLGSTADLTAFLFGSEREGLVKLPPLLRDLQDDRCLYCARPLGAAAVVDHFVPWTRYSIDLGHNFVLAHWSCNSSKADHLATADHLTAWVRRNRIAGDELQNRFDAARVLHDLGSSVRITRWAYAQTANVGGLVWRSGGGMESLSVEWRSLLAGA